MNEERRYELREQILTGDNDFGAIRIGVSTLFVRSEIIEALKDVAYTALIALASRRWSRRCWRSGCCGRFT